MTARRKASRRAAIGILALVVLTITALSLYLVAVLKPALGSARRTLTTDPGGLTVESIRAVSRDLTDAQAHLASFPARVLGHVPVISSNVGAVRNVVQGLLPVVTSADEIVRLKSDIEEQGLMEEGVVRLALIDALREPLRAEAEALESLAARTKEARSGGVIPPLWEALEDLRFRVESLATAAQRASGLVEVSSAIFGDGEPRRYLVMLLNNAELRGAGGIPSGIGTLSVSRGRLSLGKFSYYADLRDERPFERVAAPPDFRRRYGIYGADTTRWVDVTFSPDVPAVAAVAARLFKLRTGTSTDGAIVVDPRGLAALLPDDTTLDVPGRVSGLEPADLPDYVYSLVYEELGGARASRRRALLNIGELAFSRLLEGRFGGTTTLRRVGHAIAGGHLRFVSFNPAEAAALSEAGISGELAVDADDVVHVSVQNFGGDKLDYWIERSIEHRCNISSANSAHCGTRITLENQTPEGLSDFVANVPFNSYGEAKRLVDTYVPGAASISSVDLNDRPARFYEQEEAGHKVIGVYTTVDRGERAEITVEYEIPLDVAAYTLSVLPQPLTRDATLTLAVTVPEGWVVHGPAGVTADSLSHSSSLDRPLRVVAMPDSRTGLSALWESLQDFWREPIL